MNVTAVKTNFVKANQTFCEKKFKPGEFTIVGKDYDADVECPVFVTKTLYSYCPFPEETFKQIRDKVKKFEKTISYTYSDIITSQVEVTERKVKNIVDTDGNALNIDLHA